MSQAGSLAINVVKMAAHGHVVNMAAYGHVRLSITQHYIFSQHAIKYLRSP